MTNDHESRAENKRSGPPSPARNCTPLHQPKTKKHNGLSSPSFGLGTSSPQQYGAFSLKVEPSRSAAAHQGSSESFSLATTGLQGSSADKASALGNNKSADFCPRARSSSEGGNALSGGQTSSLSAMERTLASSQASVPALSKRPESGPHNPARSDRVAAKDLPGDTKATVHTGGRWSMDEDDILRKTVMELGAKNWKNISAVAFNGRRTDVQCLHRWQKVLRPGLVKGAWTKQEDEVVIEMVRKHGVGGIKWSVIASELPGRLGKQCRERWFNHLDPNLKRDPWSVEEDKVLMEAQQRLGNKWCQIAALLPGRSENAVKNRWNSAMRRKVQDMKKSKLQACQQQHLQQRLQQQQQPRQGEQLQQLTQHEGSGSCLQQQQQPHGAPMHHLSQPPRQHAQHAHLYQHQPTLLQHTQQQRHQQQRRQMQKDEHLVQSQPHSENQLNDLHCMENQHLHRGQGMVSCLGMANNSRQGSAERKSHKCDKSFATSNQISDPNKMFFSAPKPNVEISPITGKPKRKYTRRKQKVQSKPLVNNRFDYMSTGPHATPNGTGKKGRKAQSRMLPFAPEEDFGDHGHGVDHQTFQHNASYGTGSAFDAFWPDLGPTSGPFVPNTMNINNNVMNNSTANSSNSTIINNNNGSNGSNNLANVFEMGNGFSFGPSGGFSDAANRCEAPESSGLLNGGLSLDGTTNHDDSHGQALLEDLGFFNMQMDMSDPTGCDNVLSGMGFDSSQNHVLDQICDDFFPTM